MTVFVATPSVALAAGRRVAASVRRQVPVTRRLVRLWPILAGGGAAALVVWRVKLDGDVADLVLAAGVAIGLSPILGDASAVTLASSPTSLRLRAAARAAVALPVALLSWLGWRVLAQHHVPGAPPLSHLSTWAPADTGWLILLAILAVALALEAAGARRGAVAGITAPIVLLGIAALLPRLPASVAMLPVADQRGRWLGTVAVATVMTLVATRDPGRTWTPRTAVLGVIGGVSGGRRAPSRR